MKKKTKETLASGQLVSLSKDFVKKHKKLDESHSSRKAIVVEKIYTEEEDVVYVIDFEKPIDGVTTDFRHLDVNDKYIRDSLIFGNGLIVEKKSVESKKLDISSLLISKKVEKFRKIGENIKKEKSYKKKLKEDRADYRAKIKYIENSIEINYKKEKNADKEIKKLTEEKKRGFSLSVDGASDIKKRMEKYKKNPDILDIQIKNIGGVPNIVMTTGPLTYSNDGYKNEVPRPVPDFDTGAYYVCFNLNERKSLRCFNYTKIFKGGYQHVCVNTGGIPCLGASLSAAIDSLYDDCNYLEIFLLMLSFLKKPQANGPHLRPELAQFPQDIIDKDTGKKIDKATLEELVSGELATRRSFNSAKFEKEYNKYLNQ